MSDQEYNQCLKQGKVTFTHRNVENIYIVYKINWRVYKESDDLALINSLFVAVELTKNADFDKLKYFWLWYGI